MNSIPADPSRDEPQGNEPHDENVDEVFANFSEDLEHAAGSEVDSNEPQTELTPEDFYGAVESRPLQFQLRALFAAFLLTGLFSLAYVYQKVFGFLLFFVVASAFAARARGRRERMVATMFFGGAALLCGGLMMAESSRPPIAIVGLLLACLGGYGALHGLALVAASFWE